MTFAFLGFKSRLLVFSVNTLFHSIILILLFSVQQNQYTNPYFSKSIVSQYGQLKTSLSTRFSSNNFFYSHFIFLTICFFTIPFQPFLQMHLNPISTTQHSIHRKPPLVSVLHTMDITTTIASIAAETLSADDATQKYKNLCNTLISSQLADQAQTLMDHLITGNVPKTVSSPALNYLTAEIKRFKESDDLKTLCRYGVDKLKQFPNAFDRADANLKDCLSDLYIEEDEYLKAASTLAEIDLDRGSFDVLYKATINVRIAELFTDDSIGDVHKADVRELF